ncbi:MAG: hypothetical protein K1X57_09210 [Gemmataceae bacterium]|nr:hypothetical protein [Gemmataceae bacterium]
MIRLNSDPHSGGFVYVPTGAVTGFFPVGVSNQPAIDALTAAGFDKDRIEVLSGPQGADILDVEGNQHGMVVRFKRSLQEVFASEYGLISKADAVLRSGGNVVAVFSHGDEHMRRKAAQVLVANGGQDVTYWGRWVLESFSVGASAVPGAKA